MIRRYVARARGRALRVAGVPNLPNLPSARALAQRELRAVGRPPRVAGRGRASRPASVTSADNPAVRTGEPVSTSASPYDDPSRDVGEGPDHLTRGQALIVGLGVLLALYLLLAPGAPAPAPPADDVGHCHTCD